MKNKQSLVLSLKNNMDAIGVFIIMMFLFAFIIFQTGFHSDFLGHIDGALLRLEENKLFSDNFLFYLLLNSVSGFTGELLFLKFGLLLLLSISCVAKYCLVRTVFEGICGRKHARIASASLLVVYVIPWLYFLRVIGFFCKSQIYMGYYVPNVWHNSTMICLMPFAIVTYLMALQQFNKFDKRRNLLMVLFVVLGVFVKPSFFFIFAIAFPIIMLLKYKFGHEFWLSLIPIAAGVCCVVYEYVSIYLYHGISNDNSSMVIDVVSLFTLDFWKDHALYLFVSIAFPGLFLIAYWKEIHQDVEFWFVLIMLIVAIGIKLCCHETGSREAHGNMGWQTVPAVWFTYYYVLKKIIVLDLRKAGPHNDEVNEIKLRQTRGKVFIYLYGAHVCMGIVYLLKYLITKDYH